MFSLEDFLVYNQTIGNLSSEGRKERRDRGREGEREEGERETEKRRAGGREGRKKEKREKKRKRKRDGLSITNKNSSFST